MPKTKTTESVCDDLERLVREIGGGTMADRIVRRIEELRRLIAILKEAPKRPAA